MFRSIRQFASLAFLAVALLTVPAAVAAQDRVALEKTIRFQRGSISAVVTGRIARGTTHWYHVRARRGQEMAVVLKTGSRTAFTIYGKQSGILEGADGVRQTLVELPESGDFLIEIATDQTANYTLEVTIN